MNGLTAEQTNELREQLLARKQELQTLLDDSLEGSKPVGLDQPIGRLSRMDALQQQSMTQASRRAAEQRIARIDAALTRIDRGDYGLCLACEEEIDFGRLQAQPEAPFCIDCQSEKEKLSLSST